MNGVSIAVSTEFFQLHSASGIATIFHRRITGYTRGTFIGVGTTLGTFQGDNDTNAFLACHNFYSGLLLANTYIDTQLPIFAYFFEFDQIFFLTSDREKSPFSRPESLKFRQGDRDQLNYLLHLIKRAGTVD